MLMSAKTLLERFDWRLLAIFILIAGIVHIIVTFLAINDERGAPYARLATVLPRNQMTVTDAVTPQRQPLPYLAPDARYAFCPFETAETTMRVRALLPDLGWTIGIYAPDGTNLYFAAASAERETTIDLAILPSDDRFQGLPEPGFQSLDTQQTITAAKGLIVIRAPDKGAPYKEQAEAILAKASCVAGHT
jgi:uncharacterized membrane protein